MNSVLKRLPSTRQLEERLSKRFKRNDLNDRAVVSWDIYNRTIKHQAPLSVLKNPFEFYKVMIQWDDFYSPNDPVTGRLSLIILVIV